MEGVQSVHFRDRQSLELPTNGASDVVTIAAGVAECLRSAASRECRRLTRVLFSLESDHFRGSSRLLWGFYRRDKRFYIVADNNKLRPANKPIIAVDKVDMVVD